MPQRDFSVYALETLFCDDKVRRNRQRKHFLELRLNFLQRAKKK